MKLWPALWVLLALLAKVESPVLKVNCSDGEYPYSGHCCKKCPAGTHIGEHCTAPQTLGICMPCIGETYTEYENGLEQCLSCVECKSGFRMVRPCTVKNNTECQCKDGYYCPSSGCEECVRCKDQCPEGKQIVHRCSATTDLECGTLPTEFMNPTLILGLIIAAVSVIVISIWRVRKCHSKKDKEKDSKVCLLPGSNSRPEASTSESHELRNELSENADGSNLALGSTDEGPAPAIAPSAPPLQQLDGSAVGSVQSNVLKTNKPYRVRVENSSSGKLKEIYFESRNIVEPYDWISLMRKCGLSDNDIGKIELDYPKHTDEQYYQMLKTLQDRFGIGDALRKLLDGLWQIKPSIYENLVNQLICNGIITLETKD